MSSTVQINFAKILNGDSRFQDFQKTYNKVTMVYVVSCYSKIKSFFVLPCVAEAKSVCVAQVLGNALYLVRIPTMSLEEFANGAAQLGILTQQETIDLFLHFTAHIKPHLNYPTKARTGLKPQVKPVVTIIIWPVCALLLSEIGLLINTIIAFLFLMLANLV